MIDASDTNNSAFGLLPYVVEESQNKRAATRMREILSE